jgi:hypothetical protein
MSKTKGQGNNRMKITRKQLRSIIRESLMEGYNSMSPFRIPYRSVGYAGRRIPNRDRAWLEFVPQGQPSTTPEDMFRAVTLLDIDDPEILKVIQAGSPKSMGPLENYDVYSVYATTTG